MASNPIDNFKPKLTFNDVYGESDFTLLFNIISGLHIYEKEIITNNQILSDKQKYVLSALNLSSQVSNGGFIQYFYNGYGKEFPIFCQGLKKFNANDSLQNLINRVDKVYVEILNKFNRSGDDPFGEILSLYHSEDPNLKAMNDFDFKFYDLEAEFYTHLELLIKSNPNEFFTTSDNIILPLNGKHKIETYYDNKNKKDEFTLQEGLIRDHYIHFYENGKMSKKIYYSKLGICTGFYKFYYSNGNLKEQKIKGNYDDSYIMYYYHENGRKKLEIEVRNKKQIVLNGWSADGTQILKNGTGLYIHEYEDSNHDVYRSEDEYKNYKRHGNQKSYRNNELRLYQEMWEGKEHGCTYSYEKGKIAQESSYQDGLKLYEKRFIDGILTDITTFENGIEKKKIFIK